MAKIDSEIARHVRGLSELYAKLRDRIMHMLEREAMNPRGAATLNEIDAVLARTRRRAASMVKTASIAPLRMRRRQLNVMFDVLGKSISDGSKAEKTTASATADSIMGYLEKANERIRDSAARFIMLSERANRLNKQTMARLQEFSVQDVDNFYGRLSDLAEQAVREMWSRRRLEKEIMSKIIGEIESDELITVIGKDGIERSYAIKSYVQMVAQTELRKAQSDLTIAMSKENDTDLVQWTEHPGSCEKCDPFQGKIYSISGTDKRYPMLEEVPPIHPRCEHAIFPTVPD